MDDEALKQKMALFKYSLIAPILTNTLSQNTVKEYLQDICAKKYETPDGKVKEFTPATIKEWLRIYRLYGIDGLYPKKRSDKGKPRKIFEELKNIIFEFKLSNPKATAKSIYYSLIAKGYISMDSISLSTIQRYISKMDLPKESSDSNRRAFEFELPNDCWQSDISVGPYLNIDGRKYKTYIIAFLDDASRLVLSCKAFYSDNFVSLLSVFKDAVAKRGIPKKVFVDNGKVYQSSQMQLICASLGSVLCFAKPYSPQSKGKIERWFRTLHEQWSNVIDWNSFSSLNELNESLSKYVEKQYNNIYHSSIKQKPIEKFLSNAQNLKFLKSKQELDYMFLYRVIRSVRNDSTISVDNIVYEVPGKYIGCKINIRYDPTSMDKAFIFADNGTLTDTIFQVNKLDNSKVRRTPKEQIVDFSSFNPQ